MGPDTQVHKNLGRKHIKSFAAGIAHMFSCSAMHFAWLAYKNRKETVRIDLLTQRISPPEFDIERNRILVGMCKRSLDRNIKSLAEPGKVISAEMVAVFGVEDYQIESNLPTIGLSRITVTLTDDRGKNWIVTHIEDRMLLDD